MPNPLLWIVDPMAEIVVAYRENRMLKDISRRAWILLLFCFVAGFSLFGAVVEMLP